MSTHIVVNSRKIYNSYYISTKTYYILLAINRKNKTQRTDKLYIVTTVTYGQKLR